MATIRCAGRPIPPVGVGTAEVGLPDTAYLPCGWRGDWLGPLPEALSLPCPDCGGRLELIEDDA
jgi:hypothetical protein